MNEITTIDQTGTESSTGTALVIFDQPMTPAALFAPGATDPLIARIKAEVAKEVVDPTTEKGRKAIISLAMKVTKTKTAIDAARKDLVSDEKKRLAAIDAEGRRIWDELETLAKDVRRPVTEYEEREKNRIAAHEAAVAAIRALADLPPDPTIGQIAERLADAEAVSTEGREEFTALAAQAKASVVETLTAKLKATKKADEDRAELERLRREAAERERREREEAAARKAKEEAEAEAARLAAEAARAAEAERQRIQREAEEREAAIKAEAERKEREAAEALARAEREKAEAKAAAEAAARKAEEDRIRAEEDAKRREQEAADRERQRIAAEKAAEEEATRKREADKVHRARINNEAPAGLVATGLDEDTAKKAIKAIALGQVPHVTISY
ncbi:hypothetical protein [Magnetospirillum fulvum]|uniref:TolA protein n=1 Tax=Magnetospirillum fulvum MGU-K5 TaxID=1316936 RepID=S9SCB6_MAGFU|nr:hypothetical protein [Magnetospirillum fulvum]EPY03527.1 hypothetical protein K678_00410 [Magnetospirillum fulvum MGU-K5]